MVWLKRAPSAATLLSVMADRMKAISTPRMVKVCDRRRPMTLPPRGASGTASSVAALRVVAMFLVRASGSALERVQFFDVDVRLVPEQEHQDRQPDGRLRGGHREDEEHEHLAVHVAQVVGERHE